MYTQLKPLYLTLNIYSAQCNVFVYHIVILYWAFCCDNKVMSSMQLDREKNNELRWKMRLNTHISQERTL